MFQKFVIACVAVVACVGPTLAQPYPRLKNIDLPEDRIAWKDKNDATLDIGMWIQKRGRECDIGLDTLTLGNNAGSYRGATLKVLVFSKERRGTLTWSGRCVANDRRVTTKQIEGMIADIEKTLNKLDPKTKRIVTMKAVSKTLAEPDRATVRFEAVQEFKKKLTAKEFDEFERQYDEEIAAIIRLKSFQDLFGEKAD